MGNNACPICEMKTIGKAVRDVNFCEEHRKLALEVRDFPDFKDFENKFGVIRDSEFTDIVKGTLAIIKEELGQAQPV